MRDIYLGRQAILDRKTDLFAYELLFRASSENNTQILSQIDGDKATSEVLINTFIEIGLERIAGPHRVFVNLTRSFLLQMPEIPFDKDRVVLELLEDIRVDAQVMEAVERLTRSGYRLALDDYTFEAGWDPLLPFVEIVKVELPALSMEQIRRGLPRLRDQGVKLLAEKIETREDHEQLLDLGFDYFQGYYFSRPTVLQGKRLDENQMVVLRLVSALNKPDVSINELEGLIARDAGLSYKILRYINSAAIGLPQQVSSIHKAVVLMGLSRIRAWTTLLALCRLDHKPQIHFTTALVRAHMCERLVERQGGSPPDLAFTVGLLSILDLLLDRPLAEILDELALSEDIRTALLEHKGVAGRALRCAVAYENQQWDSSEFECMSDEELVDIYLEASAQAFGEQQALQEA